MCIMGNIWKDVEFDNKIAGELAGGLNLPLPVGQVLAARGFSDVDNARKFLEADLSDLQDPYILPDIKKAAERVIDALNNNEKILVFGDFDTDGITATALLVKVLHELDADVIYDLPDRMSEGYGFTVEAFQRCTAGKNVNLIITTDCGTSSHDAVKAADKTGIDVIVTDHHTPNGKAVNAFAVVNPECGDDEDSKRLAGVGVAFKLCCVIISELEKANGASPKIKLPDLLDIVAIGTVADVVPLLGDNRILVKHGLKRLNSRPCAGLAALIKILRIDSIMTCYHVGFMLAPRLNASGRMGRADKSLELLLSTDRRSAFGIARELEQVNKERRMVENEILEEAVVDVDRRFNENHTYGIVSGKTGWHIGVIGIVAARICGRYNRPAIIVSFDKNGMGRGSCRSVVGINLMEVLDECSDLLESFGGHEMAAGISIKKENLPAFRQKFNKTCSKYVKIEDLQPTIQVDSWIDLSIANYSLIRGINKLAPVGAGNPTPVWGIRGLEPVGVPRIVGKNHIKMVVTDHKYEMEAIGFGLGDVEMPSGTLDMLVQLKDNTFGGRRSLQLNIKDFRPSCN